MHSIEAIIEDVRLGKMVILVDDEGRENEGDIILASDFVTPQAINFMVREARGLVCLSLSSDQIDRLGLPQMVRDDLNLSPNRTAFTVSIEASTGISTGISAADRSHTVKVASSPAATPADIIMPGHIFPIKAQNGGVLKRAGHTEASVDLARLAGLNPAAVICEVMNDDGSMARVEDLKTFAAKHDIKIGTIEDLIAYRLRTETFVDRELVRPFESKFGEGFSLQLFRNHMDGHRHMAIVKGELKKDEPTLVRVQVENVFSDVFGEHQSSVSDALEMINKAGRGVLVYLRNEDIASMVAGTRAPMDDKDYGVGAQILRSLGLTQIILISNHPTKRVGIKAYGIEIVDSVPFENAQIFQDSIPLHMRANEAGI